MTLYIDTSVLVSTLTKEAATERCQIWLTQYVPYTLAISDQRSAISDRGAAKFSAALSVKLRTGAIDVAERAKALSAFKTMTAQSVRALAVESPPLPDRGAPFEPVYAQVAHGRRFARGDRPELRDKLSYP